MAKGDFKLTKEESRKFNRAMAKVLREGKAFGPVRGEKKKPRGPSKPKKKTSKKSGALTTAQRKAMPAVKFVFPKGTKADPGKKKFPIHNVQHARTALSRASNKKVHLTQGERCQVMRAVCKKYPKVGMCAAPERKKQSKLLKSC